MQINRSSTAPTRVAWAASAVAAGLGFAGLGGAGGEARAAVIFGETATASSEIPPNFDRVARHAVDDSGLSAGADDSVLTDDATHVRFPPDGTMWLSGGTGFGGEDADPSYTIDLRGTYDLLAFRVWNYNEFDNPSGTDLTGRGVREVRVLSSASGTPADDVFGSAVEFPKAPGVDAYRGDLFMLPGPVRARFIKLDINTNWGDGNRFYGLSEIQVDGARVGQAVNVPGASFETPDLGAGFQYGVPVAADQPWVFVPLNTLGEPTYPTGSGLAAEGSPFTPPPTPDGDQVAFIQGLGTVSQDVAVEPGALYELRFLAASRPTFGPNDLQVMVDGQLLTFDGSQRVTPGASFGAFLSEPFTAGDGTLSLVFMGLKSTNGVGGDDVTSFIDAVELTLVPEPGGLAALALGGLALTRRRRRR